MPLLQVAFDIVDLDAAVALARAVAPFVDVIEAGTPLIKREGIAAVRQLREAVPDRPLLADMKAMDAAGYEAELAFDAGADLMTVLACAHDATIAAAIAVARERGRRVLVDLIAVPDPPARARHLAPLGLHQLGVHAGTDALAGGADGPLADLSAVRAAVPDVPTAVAGGITLASLADVCALGPAVIVVGSAITRAPDPVVAARRFRAALDALEAA